METPAWSVFPEAKLTALPEIFPASLPLKDSSELQFPLEASSKASGPPRPDPSFQKILSEFVHAIHTACWILTKQQAKGPGSHEHQSSWLCEHQQVA